MITPEAIELLKAMPVSQKPIWLNPLSMDAETNKAWDDGLLDNVRILLAEKVGSVGIRFVQPQEWHRMRFTAELAGNAGATLCLRLDPWKPNIKGDPPFAFAPFGSRHIDRLLYIRELALGWREFIGDTPTVILLDHEPPTWRHAPIDQVRARLMEVRDVLTTELPGAELSWYNNQQRQWSGAQSWPFISFGLSDQRACSMYYADVLRTGMTLDATVDNLDKSYVTTCHTFDKAWAYQDAEKPWGSRLWLPFTGERAEIYHRAVGRMVRNCHARVAYEPRIEVGWLTGLRAFIEGANGDEQDRHELG